MCNPARFDHHARLFARMADTLGVDVENEVQSGTLLPELFDSHVFECLGCTKPGECEQWIDAQEGPARSAPDYCRNKHALEALAAGQ